jgi:hypothetical protein
MTKFVVQLDDDLNLPQHTTKQPSDDGSMVWFVSASATKWPDAIAEFPSISELNEFIYSNGWTKQEEEDL